MRARRCPFVSCCQLHHARTPSPSPTHTHTPNSNTHRLVHVGVQLERQLSVRFLDVGRPRAARHAQHFVRVARRCCAGCGGWPATVGGGAAAEAGTRGVRSHRSRRSEQQNAKTNTQPPRFSLAPRPLVSSSSPPLMRSAVVTRAVAQPTRAAPRTPARPASPATAVAAVNARARSVLASGELCSGKEGVRCAGVFQAPLHGGGTPSRRAPTTLMRDRGARACLAAACPVCLCGCPLSPPPASHPAHATRKAGMRDLVGFGERQRHACVPGPRI